MLTNTIVKSFSKEVPTDEQARAFGFTVKATCVQKRSQKRYLAEAVQDRQRKVRKRRLPAYDGLSYLMSERKAIEEAIRKKKGNS
jgi:hypothetical protein